MRSSERLRAGTLALFLVGLAISILGCGPALSAAGARDGRTLSIHGRLTYDSRHPTPTGTSAEVEARPARFVSIELLDARGAVLAEGQTDANGAFTVRGPDTATTARFLARAAVRGHDVSVARDPNGEQTHFMDVPLSEPEAPLAAHARDEDGHAGAFHVLDTLLRGLDAVHTWSGRTLPPLFTYWVRGGTREWSFYRGERPHGSGRYALELLGGDPGQASTTDTDEHDEGIILHELGHFVMDRISSDSSTGGRHPRGARIDPGLAWEEGRATWFALAVLRQPLYQDTIGVEPWGQMRVDEDLERGGDDEVAGLGSETSVAAVLWDLSDGGDSTLPDADDDGVAIGPAAVLDAMVSLATVEGSYNSLPTFLTHLTTTGAVEADVLRAMLQRTGQPADLLPPPGELAWPRVLAVPGDVSAKIDGLTQPAPSGGPNLPTTGFDAIHTYRISVTEPGMLLVRLDIVGSGRIADRSDLDLELLDMRADRLAGSNGESARESLAHIVSPGYYIVRVRDGGNGNRADYRLEVVLETL